jgi:hypothetical protein
VRSTPTRGNKEQTVADSVVHTTPLRGRAWSWAALVFGLVLWAATLPTFGLSVFLCPISVALTGVAWYRDRRDLVFWIALAVNAQLALVLLGYAIGLLTGDVAIGVD